MLEEWKAGKTAERRWSKSDRIKRMECWNEGVMEYWDGPLILCSQLYALRSDETTADDRRPTADEKQRTTDHWHGHRCTFDR